MEGRSLNKATPGGAVQGDTSGVSALKEGAASSSLAPLVVKTDQAESVFVVDVEGAFPSEPREKAPAFASASTLSPIYSLSHYAKAT